MAEKTTSDVMLEIASHYLMNGCDGCDFLCVSKTCDSIPINCNWMRLYHYFKNAEDKGQDGEQEKEVKCKDCKNGIAESSCIWCYKHHMPCGENYHCSDGERKDGEHCDQV